MALIRYLAVIVSIISPAVPINAAWSQATPSDRDEIIHVLNRITFGPRPGDVGRLNFAMDLTNQKLSDVVFDPTKVLAGISLDQPDALLNQCVSVFLQGDISSTTRKVLEKVLMPPGDSQTVNPSKLIALIIGSPDFQRK
jgi:hypothetical protein